MFNCILSNIYSVIWCNRIDDKRSFWIYLFSLQRNGTQHLFKENQLELIERIFIKNNKLDLHFSVQLEFVETVSEKAQRSEQTKQLQK